MWWSTQEVGNHTGMVRSAERWVHSRHDRGVKVGKDQVQCFNAPGWLKYVLGEVMSSTELLHCFASRCCLCTMKPVGVVDVEVSSKDQP